MAEAKAILVERIVTGPKPIIAYDKDGKKFTANVGDKVLLTPNAAKRFARYCEAPGVQAAQAKVEEEVVKAEAVPEAAPQAEAKPGGGGAQSS